MKTKQLIQGTQEWLDWRYGIIGASDASAIMGISPWTTKAKLWEQKIFRKAVKTNPAMQRGKDLEESARRCFEKKMGISVFPVCAEHDKLSWMGASFDGLDMDEKILVEIKCGGEKTHAIAKEGKVPDIYYPQLQHQLEVSGLDSMYYFSFDGSDGEILEVKRDQSYIDRLVQKEKEFYDSILEMDSPALSDEDYNTMEEDGSWYALSEEWKETTKKRKQLEEYEEKLRNQLILLSGDKNSMGNGIRLTKIIQKGGTDYSKIPELKGVNLEIYRKKSFVKYRISGDLT